eukprot:778631-Amphidinium_carterae.1
MTSPLMISPSPIFWHNSRAASIGSRKRGSTTRSGHFTLPLTPLRLRSCTNRAYLASLLAPLALSRGLNDSSRSPSRLQRAIDGTVRLATPLANLGARSNT